MRALIIGDSYCRDIDCALLHNMPTIKTYSIVSPRKMNNTIHRNREDLANVTNFGPTVLILHLGHNDIAFHHHLNAIPQHPRVVASKTIEFAQEVANNHPGIKFFISSIYPRTCTPTSYFGSPEIISYNKKVKRYGQHLRTLTTAAGFQILLNNILWRRISKSLEESIHYTHDGLHITFEAKLIITKEWLVQINNS